MLPGMPVEVPAAREIVPNVNRLAAAVRQAGGKVVWVQMSLVGQRERWSVYFDADSRDAVIAAMTPGSKGYELHAELDVRDEDLIVEKNRYSAFIQGSSDIDAKLRALDIDTVVVAGTLTNVCCESSARDAMMLNYKVAFVSDANAAINDTEHNGTLTSIARVFGDVGTTDEIIARLVPGRTGTGTTQPFSKGTFGVY
jgi:ureidoacrylate peracid hydrolase